MGIHTFQLLKEKESEENPTILLLLLLLDLLIFLKYLYNTFAPTIKGKNKNKVDNRTGKCLPSQLYKEFVIIMKTNMEILQGEWKEETCRP